MKHLRERMILGTLLLGGPLVLWLGVIRPWTVRVERIKARTEAAARAFPGPFNHTPVSREERTILADPAAAWRQRMPVLEGDRARLVHYHRVVSEFQRLSREGGAPVAAVRSSWDPIRGSYTLPVGLSGALAEGLPLSDAPERKVEGWVLEARLEGSTPQLFRALRRVSAPAPLLEPIGFRWSFMPGRSRTQYLLVRNLVLTP